MNYGKNLESFMTKHQGMYLYYDKIVNKSHQQE
jgi:hypothetical protein